MLEHLLMQNIFDWLSGFNMKSSIIPKK